MTYNIGEKIWAKGSYRTVQSATEIPFDIIARIVEVHKTFFIVEVLSGKLDGEFMELPKHLISMCKVHDVFFN